MDNTHIKIQGGVPLNGQIEVFGEKNSVAKIMVASLLSDKPSILRNICHVVDTELMTNVIRAVGGEAEEIEERVIRIENKDIHNMDEKTLQEVVGKSRVPILLCGPLLARTGEAIIPALGGDIIGNRPVDLHLTALKKMGAKIEEKASGIYLKAKKLHGRPIRLDYPSVGATEQILMAAVLAEGITQLSNAAIEPQIMDLVVTLRQMGADIIFEPERTFIINGVNSLSGYDHTAIPDRLEIASWACVALGTNGKISVTDARAEHMRSFLDKFEAAGGAFTIKDHGMEFWRGEDVITPTHVETDVSPGFATDWQPPFAVVLTQANGQSIVHETVYESRFGYVEALNKMGADITLEKRCRGMLCRFNDEYYHTAIINGPTPLHGAEIEVPDIRAGFSYIVGALMAQGTTTVTNSQILNRGYEKFTEKLQNLGAQLL
ncbi:MAG: UDP-N-acetylglucosamine 1-carboxyvinyltransferase [Candidatus Blackburnbacteria bacterium RIFCSPHIGHO2_01_FULL_44_64]|uniref:UDP-N-acetylglucosamine 1-carboxyvinyltransferase n=1 Tax=Candidatus Blackburnbacteria bacterium RIFCSPHIGHO2_02_FULL_44_20 TaxID=1797516 RepID=A0A1G1V5H9_9BACT|nr:MAG: UDP-N-acetylglucosamine 1-carboxyvinyltransferase [Candidatus Blackburnbacteria bacterium RIFCSPHIGHO2_01_FULL_44_64]OGY10587.1 MAG: UDP-N-acetylglucosamine 1-carboxyvinyltransferase [Candidatus Blackburnbacteria bacterium RIFCSPHIGHO2_12_FULL_44_25]OGY10623.1 MAG: UDP-N-acetylglucosamine 1-carboxyvinyltransferase [Candidatus Blackburnbacteria bacterium RIFCSPHIGHO2_02_FULL_44_20]OGY15362.1 MAG: UDP-N-acetylglucosamine 1-carboxyvinyltransferase [Candidatus Blackburnbacteria bacterium RIF